MATLTVNELGLGTILSGFGGDGKPPVATTLAMPGDSRDKHLYVAGATGSGKSMFLESLIRQDIINHRRTKNPIILLDPHGSLFDGIMNWAAKHRLDRPIIPIDLRRDDWVVGYNAIRQRAESSPSVVVDAFVRTMAHAWGAAGTDQTPLLARWLSNLIEVLYEKGLTLPQAIHLLSDSEIRSSLTSRLRDEWVARDWAMAHELNAKEFEQMVSSTINRLRRFVGSDQFKLMFGQADLSLDLRRALDEGWILLISLATEGGKVSRQNADLFGSMFLTDLWTAAQERGKRTDVKPCRIYLDEFQSFISPTIAENLDQSRGFGLSWTMAHQFPLQLTDRGDFGKQLWHSVMENASSKVVFRMSDEENLRPLAQWLFRGIFDPDEIKHVMYSTKVMDYVEEEQIIRTKSRTRSDGGSTARSKNRGKGAGLSVERRQADDEDAGSISEFENEGESDSEAESYTDTDGFSESFGTILRPVIGQEISHVQFRSLEEQQSRAMAALFGQPQRNAVVRLLGMNAPVVIRTLPIKEQFINRDRINSYAERLYSRWNFCLSKQEAMKTLAAHDLKFLQQFGSDAIAAEEPKASGIKLPKRKT